MRAAVREWLRSATSTAADWPVDRVLALKGARRVSVVIPARDEAGTIGPIVDRMRSELLDIGLIDELVVMNSDSADATARLAAEHGARVHAVRDVRPELGGRPGKGEALWKSLFVTTGEVLVFVDADLTEWGTHFVTGLLGPLFADADVQLVKGFYDRLLDDGTGVQSTEGGRVTELVARPLLNLWWPDLAGVVQPLAGEWAIRRSCFEQLSVPTGYGVEMATLLDVHARHGLAAIAQVDLGSRAHSHQSVHDLAVMAAEILAVAAARSETVEQLDEARLWQFSRDPDQPWRGRPVPTAERPPAVTTSARLAGVRSPVC